MEESRFSPRSDNFERRVLARYGGLVMGAIALLLFVACSQQEKVRMRERFDAYITASNAHDKNGVMAQLSEDFLLILKDTGARMTQQDLDFIIEFETAVNFHARVTEIEIVGDTLVAHLATSSDMFQLVGIDALPAIMRCTFHRGLLRRVIYDKPPGTTDWVAALGPAVAWVESRDPDVLDGIYSDGAVVFSYESGIRWVELLQQWRASSARE